MGPWYPTSRKVREKWGTLCWCGAYEYTGPSLGVLRLARRSPLPQDDKSEAALAGGGNMASDGNSLRSRGFCKALGVLRLRATARGARRRAPLRMTNWSFTLRTWGLGAGRRWGRVLGGGWRRLPLRPLAIRGRCGGRRCAGCLSVGPGDLLDSLPEGFGSGRRALGLRGFRCP